MTRSHRINNLNSVLFNLQYTLPAEINTDYCQIWFEWFDRFKY
jgi:hypothetical protein